MDIHASMTSVLESEDILGDLFYKTFLSRHPDVQQYFEGVNMTSQAVLLTTALVIIERYEAMDSAAAEQYLRVLGSRHYERKIPKELFPEWTQAMLDTLAEFHGPDWSDALGVQWRKAIERSIVRMMEGYDQYHNF